MRYAPWVRDASENESARRERRLLERPRLRSAQWSATIKSARGLRRKGKRSRGDLMRRPAVTPRSRSSPRRSGLIKTRRDIPLAFICRHVRNDEREQRRRMHLRAFTAAHRCVFMRRGATRQAGDTDR